MRQGSSENRAGELLREREKARGATEPGTNRGTTTRLHHPTASPPPPTLRELGISKQQSTAKRAAKGEHAPVSIDPGTAAKATHASIASASKSVTVTDFNAS